ncbi:MAG: response regulator transcription factor [Aequorivita sp.]
MKLDNISIIIADDHPVMLKGLYDELTENGYNVVGKAINGMQALELVLTLKPSVALLDIDMPLLTGFEVIKMAKEKNVATKFVVLSFHKENKYIAQAKTLQINGYLLKEDSFSVVEDCIKRVVNDHVYFSPSFEDGALHDVSEELKRLGYLTSSEKTILKLIAQQNSTQEIADLLCVSARTVEKHRSNIINKLELGTGSNTLARWALSNKNTIKEL